jgi:hypothetical protein
MQGLTLVSESSVGAAPTGSPSGRSANREWSSDELEYSGARIPCMGAEQNLGNVFAAGVREESPELGLRSESGGEQAA